MKKRLLLTLLIWIAISSFVWIGCAKKQAKSVNLNILAGMSLKNAMQEIKEIYSQQKPNVTLTYKFGNSGAHQKAIEQGAMVDIFITGSPKFMDNLQFKGLLLANTRKIFLHNKIALIAPKDSTGISDFKDLTAPQVKKVAITDPKSGSSGKFGQEVFTSLGILESVKPKFVFVPNSADVPNFVETGKTDAGIGYATDVILSTKIRVVAIAPENTHSPSVYSIAVLKGSQNIPEAKELVQFLISEQARSVFVKYGFAIVTSDKATP